MSVEIHKAAQEHGIADADIQHATSNAIVIAEIERDSAGSKVLVLGPDRAGNLLEVVLMEFDDDRRLAIHAMPMRAKYEPLLRPKEAD